MTDTVKYGALYKCSDVTVITTILFFCSTDLKKKTEEKLAQVIPETNPEQMETTD